MTRQTVFRLRIFILLIIPFFAIGLNEGANGSLSGKIATYTFTLLFWGIHLFIKKYWLQPVYLRPSLQLFFFPELLARDERERQLTERAGMYAMQVTTLYIFFALMLTPLLQMNGILFIFGFLPFLTGLTYQLTFSHMEHADETVI